MDDPDFDREGLEECNWCEGWFDPSDMGGTGDYCADCEEDEDDGPFAEG